MDGRRLRRDRRGLRRDGGLHGRASRGDRGRPPRARTDRGAGPSRAPARDETTTAPPCPDGRRTLASPAGLGSHPLRAAQACARSEPDRPAMDLLPYLAQALTPFNLLLALGGVFLGTVIGALPASPPPWRWRCSCPSPFAHGARLRPHRARRDLYRRESTAAPSRRSWSTRPARPRPSRRLSTGFPMAKRNGDGNLAVTLATLASVVGGLRGRARPCCSCRRSLSKVALAFGGPPEYFWLDDLRPSP